MEPQHCVVSYTQHLYRSCDDKLNFNFSSPARSVAPATSSPWHSFSQSDVQTNSRFNQTSLTVLTHLSKSDVKP